MADRKTRMLEALTAHIGAANGATAAVLATKTHMDARTVRRTVTELIEDGIAVCSHPKTGYYVAANAAEINDAFLFHHKRALHELHKASRLASIRPDLVGQLKLPT